MDADFSGREVSSNGGYYWSGQSNLRLDRPNAWARCSQTGPNRSPAGRLAPIALIEKPWTRGAGAQRSLP